MNTQQQEKASANAIRAGWAQRALAAFILSTGVDKDSAVADLITNLQHLCVQDPSYGDFQQELARSIRNFENDADDDPLAEFNADQIGPVIVIDVDNGVFKNVRASEPVRVLFLDVDTEGGDEERIYTVEGSSVYVTEWLVLHGDVEPNEVAEVVKEIDDADSL